jgi:hypothetical protein
MALRGVYGNTYLQGRQEEAESIGCMREAQKNVPQRSIDTTQLLGVCSGQGTVTGLALQSSTVVFCLAAQLDQ